MNNTNNKKTSDSLIGKVVDTFDEACKQYYQTTLNEEVDNTSVSNYKVYKKRSNYYECLLKMYDVFMGYQDLDEDNPLHQSIITLFNKLEEELSVTGITNEEMRKALLLLDINGFKNLGYPLDYITPDFIGYLIAHMIMSIINNDDKLNILDFNFGIGNLAYSVINELPNGTNLYGIENHQLLVDIASHKAEMMTLDVNLFHQDALEYIPSDIDIVISDVATNDYQNDNYHSSLYDKGVRYFPYLAIERYLDLNDNPLYFYVIDNDFFNHQGSNAFKEMIKEKGRIICLITLPNSLFQDEKHTRSLLVLDKGITNKDSTDLFMLPNPNDTTIFMQTFVTITNQIKEKYKK